MNFNIDRYLTLVEPLDDADIDYDAFLTDPLDEDTLRCLRYMHDVEFHTTCYLRDLLVTSTHRDPEITAFLAMWCYEEVWDGEAIAKVLPLESLCYIGFAHVETIHPGRERRDADHRVRHPRAERSVPRADGLLRARAAHRGGAGEAGS